MAQWRISNTDSGAELGTYEGETADEALDTMAREAGYESHAAACEAVGDDGVHVEAVEPERCSCTCGCELEASTTDDAGNAVCDGCAVCVDLDADGLGPCEHCAGTQEEPGPATARARWIGDEADESEQVYAVCRACLEGGAPDGPGYRQID